MLPTQDINRDKKFHPVRYYMVVREKARILISHATATWLGLVKIICKNKASKIKRQAASISKKTAKPWDSNKSISLFRTNTPSQSEIFSCSTTTSSQSETFTDHYRKATTTWKTNFTAMLPEEMSQGQATPQVGRWPTWQSVCKVSFFSDQQGASTEGTKWPHTLQKRNILFLTITVIVALIPGPPHPPKVKYQQIHQNVNTTSHRRIKKLTTSILKAIPSSTKTHRRL